MRRVPRNSRLLGALPFLALVLHQVQFMVGKGKSVHVLLPSSETRYLADSKESSTHRSAYKVLDSVENRRPSSPKLVPPIQKSWWEDHVDLIAVTYKKWNGPKYGWCLHDDKDESPTNETSIIGLLYAKTFKTGSSTAAALALRISHKVGERHLVNRSSDGLIGRPCKTFFQDEFMLQNGQSRRRQPSLLWTVVRNPARHVQSAFNYFHMGLRGIESVPDEQMIDHFSGKKNVQVEQLMTLPGRSFYKAKKDSISNRMFTSPRILSTHLKRQIFDSYDFVAVLERWEESIAVMQLLLDLEDEDMIILSSKSAGSWTWNLREPQMNEVRHSSSQDAGCVFIPEPKRSSKVEQYLSTNFTLENADFLLHAAANRSLDLTINAIGRDRVEYQVNKLRKLQTLVETHCLDSTEFPCSSNGTLRSESKLDCYWRDLGCGHTCVDTILAQHKLGIPLMPPPR